MLVKLIDQLLRLEKLINQLFKKIIIEWLIIFGKIDLSIFLAKLINEIFFC